MKKVSAFAAVAALMAMAGTAMAATTSTNLTVSASVAAACTATTATNIDFGALDPINDPATSSTATKAGATRGEILVKCTQGANYTLTAPASATIANTGGDLITYTPVLPTVPANDGLVAGRNYMIDAQVNKTAYSAAPAGAYTGTLTVTVNY